MKTLTVLWVVFCLAACGGDPVTKDPPKECYGDQDCPTMSKCLENVCIDHPECITNTECTDKDPAQACVLGKCTPYVEKDSCYKQVCGDAGTCDTCGELTACRDGVCNDACALRRLDTYAFRDIVCAESTSTCLACVCWRDGRKIGDGWNHVCIVGSVYPVPCTVQNARDNKKQVESIDYDKAQQDSIAFWKTACSKGNSFP